MARRIASNSVLKYDPDYAVPPGRTLLETIESLGLEQKELSQRTGYTEKHVSQIVRGKSPISPDAALRFEQVTGVPARVWIQLESHYQERLAKLEARKRDERHLAWLDSFPYAELAKRQAIPKCDTKTEYVHALLAFFRVATVEAWHKGWAEHCIAFRKSTKVGGSDAAIAAWVRLAEIQAEQIVCQPFNLGQFRAALTEIRKFTTLKPEVFVPKMKHFCSESGIALALVPELPGAPVSGAARWISRTKGLIALNLRGKANDRFWFTFFHEAGHILHDDRKEVFIDVKYADDPTERAANDFAADFLVPPEQAKLLKTLKSKSDVVSFASNLGIHPGIVVGRLQHEGVIAYSHLNELKSKLIWSE